jgi:hypothetical protein
MIKYNKPSQIRVYIRILSHYYTNSNFSTANVGSLERVKLDDLNNCTLIPYIG